MATITYIKFLSAILLVLMVCNKFERSLAVQKFCGKALGEALDNICYKGFNTKIKRTMLDVDDSSYNDIEDDFALPWSNPLFMSQMHGDSMVTKTRRRRHGVYDECCRKGCTYNELLSYCLV